MQLTEGQGKAIEMVKSVAGKQFRRPQILVLRGYAGTGKTTLLKMLQEEVGDIIVLAPTGKAALRVQEATGLPSQTMHLYLYNHRYDQDRDEFIRNKKNADEIQTCASRLVVVDEASMVDESIWDDLFEGCSMIGHNILLVGDPFQLPPVAQGKNYFSTMDSAFMADQRVDLTEILRQALDNPIIRSSMHLRKGDTFSGLREIPRVLADDCFGKAVETYKSGGIAICHKNETRNTTNRIVRKLMGLPPKQLVTGEPLLVTRNNYDLNVYNGQGIRFEGWAEDPMIRNFYDKFNSAKVETRVGLGMFSVSVPCDVTLSVEEILGTLDPKHHGAVAYYMGKLYKGSSHMNANLGYVATCHKFQGSQASDVFVMLEPSVKMNTREGQRWIYTAITRSTDKVSVCFVGDLFDRVGEQ